MKPTEAVDMEAIYAEIDALPTISKGRKQHFTEAQDKAIERARERGVTWLELVRYFQKRWGFGSESTLRRHWREIGE